MLRYQRMKESERGLKPLLSISELCQTNMTFQPLP